MIKRFWGVVLTLLMIALLTSPQVYAAGSSDSENFNDVQQTYWASDAINFMAQSGVVSGYPDGTYKPGNPVSREEFATMIAKSFYLDLPDKNTPPDFIDVQPDHWSFQYVEAAKDFLTGYYPPSGHAFFSPTATATREDVAVALVKAMGYTPDDLQDRQILEEKFSDAADVSPNLHDYVALAVEKNLFSGYPDGTFKPNQGVTRAEVAYLLDRVIKASTSDGKTDITLDVSAPATTSDSTVYITGTTTPGATVTINDQPVEVVQGQFSEAFKMDQEGSYPFIVVARIAGGKTKTVTKTVVYKHDGPTIDFSNLPTTTDTEKITITGTVTDPADPSPKLYLNGNLINTEYSDEFETDYDLQEGANTLTFTATNSFGKTTTVTKTITLTLGGPKLQLGYIPATTTQNMLTISGSVTDPNDQNPKVYLNNQLLNAWGSDFDTTITLQEGENDLTFIATDADGKQTTVTKTITFTNNGPSLTLGYLPDTTTLDHVQVSWTVSDANDSDPQVYVNDQPINYDNSQDVALQPGKNTITVLAVDKLGQSTTQTKTITFNPSAPTLNVGYVPDTTTNSTLTLTWSIKDQNDPDPQVFVNDELIQYNNSQTVNLAVGVNTFVIKASNVYGQVTTVTITVTRTQ